MIAGFDSVLTRDIETGEDDEDGEGHNEVSEIVQRKGRRPEQYA